MGYAHGNKWTNKLVEEEIYKVMDALNLKRMPSRSEMKLVREDDALSNKISKTGGFKKWANKLNLEIKNSETQLGQEFEIFVKNFLNKKLGYEFTITSTRHPYDLYFKGVKIDVKVGNRYYYDENNYYHSFNLEKIPPTCDIYICMCKNNENIDKILIIPSVDISNLNQLSVGKDSIYDKYIDRYDIIKKYYEFYKGGI